MESDFKKILRSHIVEREAILMALKKESKLHGEKDDFLYFFGQLDELRRIKTKLDIFEEKEEFDINEELRQLEGVKK